MGLDTPRQESKKNGEQLFNSRGLLEKASYDSHILPSFKNNPDLDVSKEDGAIVREYLERQSPGYLAELQTLIKNAPPFSATTKLSLAIPAYKEASNIYKTLEQYSKLENHAEFEIVILENHTKNIERDTTASEITRFKESHPDIQIVHLYKTFDEKRIGDVRKYLTDSILVRKQSAGREDSTIIASNDADLEDINPQYANLLIKTFAANPALDAIRGGADRPSDSFKQFPLMHVTVRFVKYFRMIAQQYMPNTYMLVGRNTVMRSGIYAAAGGYNEKATVSEDVEIGQLISHGRQNRPGHMRYIRSAWIETNPRREIEAVLTGTPLIHRYGRFQSNEDIYDIPIEELMQKKQNFSPERLNVELQAIYDHYKNGRISEGGWFPDVALNPAFDRAMRFLGIKYHIEDDKVVLDDLSKLTNDLERYADKHKNDSEGI